MKSQVDVFFGLRNNLIKMNFVENKTMGGKTNRTRGHNLEREVAKILRDEGIFPNAERLLEYQASQANGVDLKNTGNLRIQCKRAKKSVPMNKIHEIQDLSGISCLVSKVDRDDIMITLKFSDFVKIIKDIGEVYE